MTSITPSERTLSTKGGAIEINIVSEKYLYYLPYVRGGIKRKDFRLGEQCRCIKKN